MSVDSQEILTRLRHTQGDRVGDDLMREVYRHYFARLVGLLRSWLPAHLQAKVSASDLAQSALLEFSEDHRHHRHDLGDWDSLWPLLVRLAGDKLADCLSRYATQGRDVRREIPLEAAGHVPHDYRIRASLPDPVEVVAANEVRDLLAARLSPRSRQVLVGCLEGHSQQEIADAIGTSVRTVKRIMNTIRDGLLQLDAPSANQQGDRP